MKLPFNIILSPMLKPYLRCTGIFCEHPTFAISLIYIYFYGILGFFLSANHLLKHFGESVVFRDRDDEYSSDLGEDSMVLHDMKIIATSMRLVQYACLLVGCLSKNPALFLPHLAGQFLTVIVKVLNALLLLSQIKSTNVKSTSRRLQYKLPEILVMTFNWFQEFCVFRKFLCICDL